MKLFEKLIRNKDGNIALMGGVSLGVLAFGIGVAIDSVGMHKFQEDMQRQLDIAALTAVIEVNRNRTELAIDSQDSDEQLYACLLYTSPSPRDKRQSRMPSSA